MHVDATAADEETTPVETIFSCVERFCLISLLLLTSNPPKIELITFGAATGNTVVVNGKFY